MPYVYRYIDIKAEEVIYVGKVTGHKDMYNDPLLKRHEQHCREGWYRDRADDIIMQYIETKSHVDADMLESWLISYYDTGQLINKAKTGWGKSDIDLSSLFFGHWITWNRGSNGTREAVFAEMERLLKKTEGLTYNLSNYLEEFCDQMRQIQKEHFKANGWSRYDEQEDFKRRTTEGKVNRSKTVQNKIIEEWRSTHKGDKRFIPIEAARLNGQPIIAFLEPDAPEKQWSVQYAGNGRYFDTQEEALEYMNGKINAGH